MHFFGILLQRVETMELNKTRWTKSDIEPFLAFLKQQGNPQKEAWSRRILNTQMPLYALKTEQIVAITKQIGLGNFLSFIQLHIFDCYESMAITGNLICKLSNFDELKKQLTIYGTAIDNWALCDLLKFPITPNNQPQFIALANDYLKSAVPFLRRMGVMIYFHLAKQPAVLPDIFEVLNNLQNETHYYVNMAAAWLLCECMIQHPEETLAFYKQNKTNAFVINKSIQKCRDSYRVDLKTKDHLLQYKIKL